MRLVFTTLRKSTAPVFQQCSTSASNGIMTSGRDVVPLQTPGRKWYICGVGKHCESRNMKLVITVLPQTWAPAPSPIATSTSGKLAVPTIYGFVLDYSAVLYCSWFKTLMFYVFRHWLIIC
ncbi:putative Phytocyanin domain, cupredoxin [Helianthus annuus]|nr:putative Phytocyanin domain, cupredoxin [Helianthus annuus]